MENNKLNLLSIDDLLKSNTIVVGITEEEISDMTIENLILAKNEAYPPDEIIQAFEELDLIQVVMGSHLGLTVEETLNTEVEGDTRIIVDGTEYFCGNEEQTNEAVSEYISETIWAFNTSFLERYGVLGDIDHDDCELMLEPLREQCEDSNDTIKILIDWNNNEEDIVEAAISEDGAGHFLNSYDGNYDEITLDNIDYTICRID